MASDVKWIKITTEMFEDEKIDFINGLPESDAILVIWVRLLTMAGKCNAGGFIMLTESIPYTEEMLANKFRKPLNTIRLALETFSRLGMMSREGDGRLHVSNWEKHQNVDGLDRIREKNRLRQLAYRRRKSGKEEECPENPESLESDVMVGVTDNALSQDGNALRIQNLELEKESKNKDQEFTPTSAETETASPTTAVAVVSKAAVKKSTDMGESELALYHLIEDWFKKVPGSENIMYKDRASASRTGKAIKTIVGRCFTLGKKDAKEAAVIARGMIEAFYHAVNGRGGTRFRSAFTPVSLATEWIWDTLYASCYARAEAAVNAESVADRLERIRREREQKEKKT